MTDFYQSPADALRFDILLKSLVEGSLNLAIVGEDEAALASYGRQIFDYLKRVGEKNVEWWSSADSEKLVQRFNDILSELTVDEALDKSQKRSPKRYMIFPDTHAIQDFELQLLARLINGFPTSNINLVLVVNQQDPYEEKLAVFGKNLLQWVLESENPGVSGASKSPRSGQKTSYIETLGDGVAPRGPGVPSDSASVDAVADFSATFAATLASGKFPGPGQQKRPATADQSQGASVKESLDPLDASPGQAMQADAPQHDAPLSSGAPSKSWGSRIAGILIVAILTTVGAVGLIYKDEVSREAQNLEDFVSGKKPVVAKVVPPPKAAEPLTAAVNPAQSSADTTAVSANQPPPAVGMSSSVIVPVKTGESLIPNKEVLIAPNVATPSQAPLQQPNPAVTLNPSPSSPNAASKVAALNVVPSAAPVPPASQVVGAKTTQSQPPSGADGKAESKSEPKSDSKALTKEQAPTQAKEPAIKGGANHEPVNKEVVNKEAPTKPKERKEPKEAQPAAAPIEAKDPNRESKPNARLSPKESPPLPKLDPRSDKQAEARAKTAGTESMAEFKPRPEDQRWVQQIPEDGWVMQHAALDTLEEARAFQQSSPFYRDARVMYTKRKDAPPYYIVVSGPFNSRQDAEAEARRHPIMAKSWVRTARSLKNQFEE